MSNGAEEFAVLIAQDGWWKRLDEFRKDMRAKGIHVHVGTSQRGSMPTCVTCDEVWPCSKAGKGE